MGQTLASANRSPKSSSENATTIGLPCATAPADDIEALMATVEEAPGTQIALSIRSLSLTAAGKPVRLYIPPVLRDSLLTGQWDATGLLLSDFDDVGRVASRLPYVSGF